MPQQAAILLSALTNKQITECEDLICRHLDEELQLCNINFTDNVPSITYEDKFTFKIRKDDVHK